MAAIIELKAIIAESSEVIAEGEKIHRRDRREKNKTERKLANSIIFSKVRG
jgi:hypothetical protein